MTKWFRKDSYLNTYEFPINPLTGRKFWLTSEEGPLEAPMARKMPWRPVKKRRKGALEGKTRNQAKLSRKGRVMRCRICCDEGHNRIHCP